MRYPDGWSNMIQLLGWSAWCGSCWKGPAENSRTSDLLFSRGSFFGAKGVNVCSWFSGQTFKIKLDHSHSEVGLFWTQSCRLPQPGAAWVHCEYLWIMNRWSFLQRPDRSPGQQVGNHHGLHQWAGHPSPGHGPRNPTCSGVCPIDIWHLVIFQNNSWSLLEYFKMRLIDVFDEHRAFHKRSYPKSWILPKHFPLPSSGVPLWLWNPPINH